MKKIDKNGENWSKLWNYLD